MRRALDLPFPSHLAMAPGAVAHEGHQVLARTAGVRAASRIAPIPPLTPWPGQELVEIPDLSRMKVSTKVNEVDAHRVAVDQEVVVEIDALAELELAGRLSSVATLAKREGQSEVKSFDVEVLLDDGDERLRPGMTASCRILVERYESELSVPLEAVFALEGRTVCYVVGGGIEEREVVLGARNEDFVVVVEGLSPGEHVSLRDPHVPVGDVGEEALEPEAGGAS